MCKIIELKTLSTPLTDDRKIELDSIVEKLDEQAERDYEYHQSEDCGDAEFLAGFFYGEADSSEVINRIESILDEGGDYSTSFISMVVTFLKGHSDLYSFLENHTEVDLNYSCCARAKNSILSREVGELETQVEEGILEGLNPLELEYIKENLKESCLSGEYMYQSTDLWWSLNIDIESMIESLELKEKEGE